MKTPLEPLESYAIRVAKMVAEKILEKKLSANGTIKHDPNEKTDPFYISYFNEITDQGWVRMAVCRFLKENKIITSYDFSTKSSSYRNDNHKERSYSAQVNEEWFEKNIASMGTKPEFKIDLSDKDITETSCYKNLFHGFTDAEFVWIYNHIEDYDLITVKKDFSRWGSSQCYIGVFPKSELSKNTVDVFKVKANNYLREHLEWAIENTLGIKGDDTTNLFNSSFFSSKVYEQKIIKSTYAFLSLILRTNQILTTLIYSDN